MTPVSKVARYLCARNLNRFSAPFAIEGRGHEKLLAAMTLGCIVAGCVQHKPLTLMSTPVIYAATNGTEAVDPFRSLAAPCAWPGVSWVGEPAPAPARAKKRSPSLSYSLTAQST